MLRTETSLRFVFWGVFVVLLFFPSVIYADSSANLPDEAELAPQAKADSEIKVIRAAILKNFPQLYMLDFQGKPEGFAIDIFEEVAIRANLIVEYVIVDTWAQALDAIRDGKADLIPGIGISPERQAEFLIINEKESTPISCFVRSNNSDINGIEDCKAHNKRVAVIYQSSAMNTLQADGEYHLVPFKSTDSGLNRLLSGDVDALVFPELALKRKLYAMGIADRVKVVGRPLKILTRGYLMSKANTALAEKLRTPLAQVVDSDAYTQLYVKWYGQSESFWTLKRALIYVGSVLGFTLLVFGVWRAIYTAKINVILLDNQEKLKQSEENYRTTLISIGDAVLATDTQMKVTQMNPKAEALTGWTLENASGMHIEEIFNIIDVQKNESAPNPVKRVLATGEVVGLSNHTVLISKDGAEYHIADSAAPIRDGRGNITGVVLVFRNVTEEYQLREKVQQSQKLDAIGQLAGGVAHDFNNMLGGIIGGAELLQQKLSDDDTESQEYLEMILNSATRAADLAQGLLSFSRRQSASSTAIDVHKVIRTAISVLEKTIDKRIQIETKLGAANKMVVGDDSQLQSVFLNLGINASHAMPEGGRLIYSTTQVYIDQTSKTKSTIGLKDGYYLQIEVRDTGTGISQEDLGHIFEPFFTTKEQGNGTGLGLAATYGTIQQHDGGISVYSELGEGTKFTILLPIAENVTSLENEKPDPTQGSGTILLVDDEAVMRASGKAILSNLGYKVYLAENGLQAVEFYNKCHKDLDLVVLDMIMPVMNGRDCFAKLRQIDKGVPIIVASGFSHSEDLHDLKKQGLAGYIQKPFRAAKFSHVVDTAIRTGSAVHLG